MKRFFAFAAVAVTSLALVSCAGDNKEKKAAEEAEAPKVEAPAEPEKPATPEITETVKKTQSEGLTLQGPKASGLQMEEEAPSKVNPELIKGVKGKK